MFYLNFGYQWTSIVDNLRGIVLLPSSNTSEKLLQNRIPDAQQVLLDPQLYLSSLNANECPVACGRLVSFPWFQLPGNLPPTFDRARQNRTAWEQELRAAAAEFWLTSLPTAIDEMKAISSAAIAFQQQISCTQVILPAPLITEREDEAATTAMWLDSGLDAARDLGVDQPLLATVAIGENVLNAAAFQENGILDTVVDQITSRDGIDGVYIVIAQNRNRHPFETDSVVLGGYLYLCSAFSRFAFETILPNFVDLFGLPCMALGATGFASGTSQTRRRLALAAFCDSPGGGKNLPHYYSHRVVAELLTETDLQRFVNGRLLSRISDRTPHSHGLIAKLRSGGSASELPPWAEGHMNTGLANKHFIYRIAQEAELLGKIDSEQRQEKIQDWLESAAANALLVQKRLGDISGLRIAPTEAWLDVFNLATD